MTASATKEYEHKSGLTTALAVTVCSDEDVSAHKSQQRPLQFGAGSVQQWAEGGRVPHLQLVGVSRQNVAHAQEGLTKRGIRASQDGASGERRHKFSLARPSNLLPHAGVRMGEAAEAPLAEDTQLESLGHGSLLRHTHTNSMSKSFFSHYLMQKINICIFLIYELLRWGFFFCSYVTLITTSEHKYILNLAFL